MLLALGAATVGVLTWTLLTDTGTASAHTPEGVDEAHDTPAAGKVDLDGGCKDATVGVNERCKQKNNVVKRWYHQNYWRPYLCTPNDPLNPDAGTTCDVDRSGTDLELDGLQFFTNKYDQPLPDLEDGELAYPANESTYWSLTSSAAKKDLERGYWKYLERLGFAARDGKVPPNGGQPANGYRSWCGAVESEYLATEEGGADCQNQGHRGNNAHEWWDHDAVEGPPLRGSTHTIYDLHGHCDAENTVHRNDDGECPEPEPVCELAPGVPAVRVEDQKADPRVVRWEAPDDGDGAGESCEIAGYQVTVTDNGTGAVRGPRDYGDTFRRHNERAPTLGTGTKTVAVRAVNNAGLIGDAGSVVLWVVCPPR